MGTSARGVGAEIGAAEGAFGADDAGLAGGSVCAQGWAASLNVPLMRFGERKGKVGGR